MTMTEAAPPAATLPPRHRRLMIALSLVCAVLLAATAVLGAATLWLSSAGSGAAPTSTPAPEPTPTPGMAAESKPLKVRDFEVTTVSDLSFSGFALTATDEQGFTALYAVIENDDPAQAAEAFFDISVYGPDDRLVGRTPSNTYLLPGQKSLFYGVIASDMAEVERIRIEQTRFEQEAPAVTGTIRMDSILGGDEGLVEGTFSSTLSAPTEYTEVFIAGFVDGELFAACTRDVDIPASGGTFTVRCRLEPASADELMPISEFPADAVFDAYFALDLQF